MITFSNIVDNNISCVSPSVSLNKSLLYWRLEHIVELHPGSHNLLFLRIVSSMLRSLAARHVGEHHQPHHGHEEHAARHRGHDQAGPGVQVGVVAGAGRVENLQHEQCNQLIEIDLI